MTSKGLGLLALGMAAFILLYTMIGYQSVRQSEHNLQRASEHTRTLMLDR